MPTLRDSLETALSHFRIQSSGPAITLPRDDYVRYAFFWVRYSCSLQTVRSGGKKVKPVTKWTTSIPRREVQSQGHMKSEARDGGNCPLFTVQGEMRDNLESKNCWHLPTASSLFWKLIYPHIATVTVKATTGNTVTLSPGHLGWVWEYPPDKAGPPRIPH